MKKIVILIILAGLLFSQAEQDTVKKIPYFDLSKGFNIPGLIPKNMPLANQFVLFPHEIEAIKQKAKDYTPEPVSEDDIVILETNRGTMKLKLFPDVAPNHCKNFKKLANSGFYDKTAFHRIIPGFMIQGGDINSRDNDPKNDGHGGPGWTVDAEFNEISHKRGILSMARSADPNSAGSQFFICVADAPNLDGQYTVFGEVIEKVHIVDHIVNTPTEYDQAIRLSKESIPEGEDPDNWITLKDPKTKKKLYSKIPQYKKKSDYEYEMRNKIKSDKPSLVLTIEKVRVIKKSEMKDAGTTD
jgi:peptidyl-prolyl cis-trans isomerase B (cyclophilin B)